MKKSIFILILILSLASPGFGQPQLEKKEKYLTRFEVAVMLSATDFLKRKIGDLLSWTVGYDITKINRASQAPTIKYLKAVPFKIPADGRTVLSLQASVDDPAGLGNIVGVRADLSPLGRLPNMMLVDNGLWGDPQPNDGVYTLQTSVAPTVTKGVKEIPVAVANKKGWLTLGRTSLAVENIPTILEAKAATSAVRANGSDITSLTVKIDNPGRIEDVDKVIVDLSSVGGSSETALYNDGTHGDAAAVDNIFTLQITIPRGVPEGEKKLPLKVTNLAGGMALGEIILTVVR